MSELYTIAHIRAEEKGLIEQLGSKPKFWCVDDNNHPWLFKYTRKNTGEHWAEKVAAELATLLDLPAAVVDLAEFEGRKGCCCKSFTPKPKVETLVHGNEILAGYVLKYDKTKGRGQSDHTMGNIIMALQKALVDHDPEIALHLFAGYIVFDAFIGNTDRHHENWGILESADSKRLAPSYDHASSMGREFLDDTKREIIIKNNAMDKYIYRGKGGIYWTSSSSKGDNPMKLALKSTKKWPDYFRPWIERIASIEKDAVTEIFSRISEDWISSTASEFAQILLHHTQQELTESL